MNPPVNPSAFPHTYSDKHETYEGMTLRDWFAGQALASIAGTAIFDAAARTTTGELADANGTDRTHLIAGTCYRLADAMLRVRKVAP
jgi:hypothetical protein